MRLSISGIIERCKRFELSESCVESCLDADSARDRVFLSAWRGGLSRLTRRECAQIAGVTGHVAESLVELVLEPLGWFPLWHFSGPGRHGVDLVFLAPGDLVVAVEVKGTLVKGRTPRLSGGELAQMTTAWIDKPDNPGMTNLMLDSKDTYGGIVIVNIADLTWRVLLSKDMQTFESVEHVEQLQDLDWLR